MSQDPEKQTVTTRHSAESGRQTARRIVSVIFAIFEVLLGFRIIFKVFGANSKNGFVSFINTMTGWLVAPFNNIFPEVTFTGISEHGVFEPGALIALIVLLVVGWLVARAIAPARPESMSAREVEHHDEP